MMRQNRHLTSQRVLVPDTSESLGMYRASRDLDERRKCSSHLRARRLRFSSSATTMHLAPWMLRRFSGLGRSLPARSIADGHSACSYDHTYSSPLRSRSSKLESRYLVVGESDYYDFIRPSVDGILKTVCYFCISAQGTPSCLGIAHFSPSLP